MFNSKRFGFLVLSILMSLSMGCDSDKEQENIRLENEIQTNVLQFNCNELSDPRFQKNCLLWQKGRVKNYEFTAHFPCGGNECLGDVVISVRDGKFVTIESVTKGESIRGIERYKKFETIENVFSYAQETINKGGVVEAKFETELGYPMEIHFSYDETLEDAWEGIVISKFELIG